MDIRQLRYFSAIAEEGQITRAAKKLHIAQPPLSAQLKSLEQELGVLLVERNGRNIVLTEAGNKLYQKAKSILQQMDETILEIKEIDEGLKGTLTIGSVKSAFSYIPKRMRLFREEHPFVKFHLKEGDSSRLAEEIINREIELAIVRLPLNMNTFNYLLLPTDTFVLAVPEEWNLPSTIKMKDISEIPLMLLHRVSGTGLYELVLEECKKHQVEPNIICECPDAAMLLSLVKARVGASLLPKSTIHTLPLNGIKLIDIEDTNLKTEAAVIWLKDRYLTKNATRFLETFRNVD
ncbi:LysR family transcriptional regulator [Bacillus sp. FJAT-45350]|uniref:LysR family transcriptional regulator n=1 Tax=Bacillus sp. FJAT-45350 TaxID=2011014 RepID=UPI000BB6CBAC|nr:LysR family transcriptional regulator [Bacillus sp. FJAT-45350]